MRHRLVCRRLFHTSCASKVLTLLFYFQPRQERGKKLESFLLVIAHTCTLHTPDLFQCIACDAFQRFDKIAQRLLIMCVYGACECRMRKVAGNCMHDKAPHTIPMGMKTAVELLHVSFFKWKIKVYKQNSNKGNPFRRTIKADNYFANQWIV